VSVEFSHLDESGRARMVDISAKAETHRRAVASGRIDLQPATLDLVRRQALPKGDAIAIARIAAIQAAKQTAHLIPLCHPLLLTDIQIEIEPDDRGLAIRASVATVGKTGAEMEALTAVSVAALTIYDLCKAVDSGMVIGEIRLVAKEGGKTRWPSPGSDRRDA